MRPLFCLVGERYPTGLCRAAGHNADEPRAAKKAAMASKATWPIWSGSQSIGEPWDLNATAPKIR